MKSGSGSWWFLLGAFGLDVCFGTLGAPISGAFKIRTPERRLRQAKVIHRTVLQSGIELLGKLSNTTRTLSSTHWRKMWVLPPNKHDKPACRHQTELIQSNLKPNHAKPTLISLHNRSKTFSNSKLETFQKPAIQHNRTERKFLAPQGGSLRLVHSLLEQGAHGVVEWVAERITPHTKHWLSMFFFGLVLMLVCKRGIEQDRVLEV